MIVGAPLRALLLAASLVAPFQCPSDPDPNKRREDTPGEALYDLAKEFRAAGDKDAEVRTLKYLVTQYPRSRHAVQAHQDLQAMGVAAPDPRDLADPKGAASAAGSGPAAASASAVPSASGAPVE